MSEDLLAPPPFVPPPSANDVELAPGVRVAPSLLRWQFARSSGPGGQNVNKVNTKAELWVPIGAIVGLRPRAIERLAAMAGRRLTQSDEIHIACETERSQSANRAGALEQLRKLIVEARHEPKARRKTKPSRASKQRRLDSKRHRGEIKSGRQTRPNE